MDTLLLELARLAARFTRWTAGHAAAAALEGAATAALLAPDALDRRQAKTRTAANADADTNAGAAADADVDPCAAKSLGKPTT